MNLSDEYKSEMNKLISLEFSIEKNNHNSKTANEILKIKKAILEKYSRVVPYSEERNTCFQQWQETIGFYKKYLSKYDSFEINNENQNINKRVKEIFNTIEYLDNKGLSKEYYISIGHFNIVVFRNIFFGAIAISLFDHIANSQLIFPKPIIGSSVLERCNLNEGKSAISNKTIIHRLMEKEMVLTYSLDYLEIIETNLVEMLNFPMWIGIT